MTTSTSPHVTLASLREEKTRDAVISATVNTKTAILRNNFIQYQTKTF